MALKDILKTFKQESILIGPLQRHLTRAIRPGTNAYEQEEWEGPGWHPSLLSSDDCLRRLQYRMLQVPESNPHQKPRIQLTFGVGHALAENVKGLLYDMGWLVGGWQCVYCGHYWLDLENPSPSRCPKCAQKFVGYVPEEGRWHDLVYREVPIVAEAPVETTLYVVNRKTGEGRWVRARRKILGHADAVVKTSVGKKLLVELKTIKNRDAQTPKDMICFEDLQQQPIKAHLYQIQLYLGYNRWGIEDGLIVYIGKNTHALKEFPVSRLDFIIDDMRDKMVAVDESIDKKVLLSRRCKTKDEGKNCPFVDFCFKNESFDEADYRAR